MNQNQLNKLCAKWQKRLRLQDWNIEQLDFQPFDNYDTYGCTKLSNNFHDASIHINERWVNSPEQIEETLIHELLHLRFPHHMETFSKQHEEGSLMEQEMELGIEMTARALFEAYKDE